MLPRRRPVQEHAELQAVTTLAISLPHSLLMATSKVCLSWFGSEVADLQNTRDLLGRAPYSSEVNT
jgi:hypothetical protein